MPRFRGNGERLPRRGPGARAADRDQDPQRPARARRAVRRALPPRGEERGRPLASERRLDLRPRRGGGLLLHRDGVPRRSLSEGADRLARAGADSGRDRLRAPDPLGAALRASQRDRASRHQAAQRPRRRRRPRQGDRLRHRARRRSVADDGGRLDRRDRAVPLARAGEGNDGRPAQRHLLARDRSVRAVDGRCSVHGRHTGRDRDEAHLRDARSAVCATPGDPARPRPRRHARARKGSCRAVPERGGDGCGPRPRPARCRDRS